MLSKTESNQPLMQYTDHPTAAAASADDDFEEGQGGAATPRQRQRPSRQVASHLVVFIATSLLWVFVLFVMKAGAPSSTTPSPTPSSSPSSTPGHHHAAADTMTTTTTGSENSITAGATLRTCGNTTAEARARDCRYDLLLNSWVPAACYDGEFEEEYLDDGSGGAFADEALTQPLVGRAAIEALPVYYTSRRDHANHCAVFWRRQFDVLVRRPLRAFDTMVIGDYHADHCSQYLIDAAEGNLTGSTRVVAGFGGCWVRD